MLDLICCSCESRSFFSTFLNASKQEDVCKQSEMNASVEGVFCLRLLRKTGWAKKWNTPHKVQGDWCPSESQQEQKQDNWLKWTDVEQMWFCLAVSCCFDFSNLTIKICMKQKTEESHDVKTPLSPNSLVSKVSIVFHWFLNEKDTIRRQWMKKVEIHSQCQLFLCQLCCAPTTCILMLSMWQISLAFLHDNFTSLFTLF